MQLSNVPPLLLSNHEVYEHLAAQKKLLDPLIAAQNSQSERRRYNGDLKLWDGQSEREKRRTRPTFMEPKPLDEDLLPLTEEQDAQEKVDEIRGAVVAGPVVMVQDMVLQYLSLPELPTLRQSSAGIEHVLSELAAGEVELTKAEMYMICNLCPASGAALYCVVEEVEDRCNSDQMEEIINLVQDSLSPPPKVEVQGAVHGAQAGGFDTVMDDEELQMQQMEEEFVHEAEWGADKEVGVEDDKDGDMD